jgi:asparagine synthase (glutamine-hydrolysing)
MCGIFALISNHEITTEKYKKHTLKMANRLRHRGPDGVGYFQTKYVYFAHERLSIVDPEGGNQPLTNQTNTLILCVNGEIFNYNKLKMQYNNYPYKTDSDCEPILALYDYYRSNSKNDTTNYNSIISHQQIVNMLGQLDGQFSFVLHDTESKMVLVARDPYGITQCYYGMDKYGNIEIASEMKALEKCVRVEVMPAGSYLYFDASNAELTPQYYFAETQHGHWLTGFMKYEYQPQPILNMEEQNQLCIQIRNTLEKEVVKRLMCDVPFGCLLSGGLDSSLIAAITMKYMREHPEIYGTNPILHTFSIGDKNSTDLPFAREVAKYINSKHHEIQFTIEDGLNVLEQVIWHLETADITTIRASTPHFLLAQKIQSLGVKMVLSGEASDEILGGYLYFHYAETDEQHQLECKRRVLDLGYFDCLRSDKSTMGNSLEARPPFLGEEFVALCININKDVKMQNGIEKYILRKAFDIKDATGANVYLPDNVLYRQKEQFSDGISGSKDTWIDRLKDITHTKVKKNHWVAFQNRHILYPVNTPQTTEAFYYRLIFEKLFPNRENTFKKWEPNTSWKGVISSDPSGRAQKCHNDTIIKS